MNTKPEAITTQPDNNTPEHSPSQYKLFMLRLWRDSPDGEWRIAIQPTSGARLHGLPSVDALTAFVKSEMGST